MKSDLRLPSAVAANLDLETAGIDLKTWVCVR